MNPKIASLALAMLLSLATPARAADVFSLTVADNKITPNNTATVYWTTNLEAGCSVDYSTSTEVSRGVNIGGTLVNTALIPGESRLYYSASLANLLANTDYYYRVNCSIASSSLAGSSTLYQSEVKKLTRYITVSTSTTTPVTNISTSSEEIKPDLAISNVEYLLRDQIINGIAYRAIDLKVYFVNKGMAPVTSNFGISVKTLPTAEYPGGFFANYQKTDQDIITINHQYGRIVATYLLPKGKPLNTNFVFKIDNAYDPNDSSIVAYSNKVIEVNEDNNAFEKLISVQSEPIALKSDLAINDLQIAEDGGRKYLKFILSNYGARTPENLTFILKAIDAETGEEYTAGYPKSLEGKSEVWAGQPLTDKPAHIYKLRAYIDVTKIVTESNEENNVFEKILAFDPSKVAVPEQKTPVESISEPRRDSFVDTAKSLKDGRVEELLAQIKQLRDELREQSAELKYLKVFASQMRALNSNMQSAIKTFVTYGVDDNTKRLGEGERAAVVSSYEAAFNKLPQTEAELADAIKIANGRFPSVVSGKAEQSAKEQFFKIYKRVADMNDEKDAAAIKVMAYGLRQQAANRNMKSEEVGIKTFKNIFGSAPKTTEQWNAMQAITYSGASRKVDTDKDGLADDTEKQLGTNPVVADSDGDGYRDGQEVLKGYDPLKK